MLSLAKSVTFNPAQPAIAESEDAADFLHSDVTSKKSHIYAAKRKGKTDPAAPPPLAAKSGTKAKGKGRAVPLDLVDLVHEGDWSRSDELDPFKHKFEVSCPRTEYHMPPLATADLCSTLFQFVLEQSTYTEEKYELFR
jgi:hypothetical protein